MNKKGINTGRKNIVGNCFIIVSYHAIVNIYSYNIIMALSIPLIKGFMLFGGNVVGSNLRQNLRLN